MTSKPAAGRTSWSERSRTATRATRERACGSASWRARRSLVRDQMPPWTHASGRHPLANRVGERRRQASLRGTRLSGAVAVPARQVVLGGSGRAALLHPRLRAVRWAKWAASPLVLHLTHRVILPGIAAPTSPAGDARGGASPDRADRPPKRDTLRSTLEFQLPRMVVGTENCDRHSCRRGSTPRWVPASLAS
jgi:hypothetical protein